MTVTVAPREMSSSSLLPPYSSSCIADTESGTSPTAIATTAIMLRIVHKRDDAGYVNLTFVIWPNFSVSFFFFFDSLTLGNQENPRRT